MCGKYDHFLRDDTKPEDEIQVHIANELAEANRLKRIELQNITRIHVGDSSEAMPHEIPKEELEDKA